MKNSWIEFHAYNENKVENDFTQKAKIKLKMKWQWTRKENYENVKVNNICKSC